MAKWDKSQPGNSQPSSLIGTRLTLPNLGFLWVFFKYPKISKNGNLLFFPGWIMQLISLIHVLTGIHCIAIYLAPVVQKVDNTIHRINLYPLNSAIGFPNTYPLDSDLSVYLSVFSTTGAWWMALSNVWTTGPCKLTLPLLSLSLLSIY